MNKFTSKVKIYVVVAIIVIVVGVKFAYVRIHSNFIYTPDTLIRSVKAMIYKNQYEKFGGSGSALAATESGTLPELDYNASVPVIVYHGIPYSDVPNQFSITLDNFKDQLFSLKKAGYNSIITKDLYRYMRGEVRLPEKPILITFDDGRVDSVELADPVLKALDYKAVMFVIGRYSFLKERQKYYISTNMIKEMDASGRWDIEAHSFDGHNSYPSAPGVTDGHFFSHKQWLSAKNRLETDEEFRTRIRTDLGEIQDGLQELLHKPIRSFAFPFGDFGQNNTNFDMARAINIDIGEKLFDMEFYQNDRHERYTNNYYSEANASSTFFLVRRFDVNSEWSGADLLLALDRSAVKKLPYIDDFLSNKGWLIFWGKVKVGSGQLSIETESGETGGTTILDGSQLWRDYSVRATVSSPAKSNVYVWTRFVDDENNTACNFGNGFIHIEQTLNGKSNIIQGKIDPKFNTPGGEFTIEARVKGRTIECILNGKFAVSSNFLDEKLASGGVGFKTWEFDPDQANMNISNLNIQEI